MYHDLPRSASFWSFLLTVDEDLAEETRKQGCPCGGRLHSANYQRKPRGTPSQLPEPQRLRLSFCCDRDGCRKRTTPHSVRFLGRKVYLAAIVVLVSAMRQGPNPRRARELSKRFGADESTITRWQTFWREHFPQMGLRGISLWGFAVSAFVFGFLVGASRCQPLFLVFWLTPGASRCQPLFLVDTWFPDL